MWARVEGGRVIETLPIEPSENGDPGYPSPYIVWLRVPDEYKGTITDDYVEVDGAIQPPSVAYLQGQRKELVSRHRWEVEVGSIIVDGVAYRGGRDDIVMLEQAITDAGTGSIDYLAITGWISATATTLQSVRDAYGARRQAARQRERGLHEMIDAATSLSDVLAVYIATGWPA